jgi:hypothetical protein
MYCRTVVLPDNIAFSQSGLSQNLFNFSIDAGISSTKESS